MRTTSLLLFAVISLLKPAISHTASLTLAEAERLAAKHHPAITEALAKWNAAEHRAVQAGLRPNPNLVVGTEGTPLSSKAYNGDYLIGVSQRIRLNGTGRLKKEIAASERQQAVLKFAAAERKVRQQVRGAFATALFAQASEQLFTDRIDILTTNAGLVKALVSAGESVPELAEVAHAELDHEELDLGEARALKERAFIALATAVGQTNLVVNHVAGELSAELGLEDLRKAGSQLDQLPGLLAAGSEVEAMELRAKLARASRIPSLNLGLMYRRSQASRRNAVDIEAAVSLPLFDDKKAATKAFEEDANAARARTESLRQAAAATLAKLHSEMKSAVIRATHIRDEILPHQQKILERRQALFEAGETSRLDYESARLKFTEEERHYLSNLHEAHRLWAELTPFLAE